MDKARDTLRRSLVVIHVLGTFLVAVFFMRFLEVRYVTELTILLALLAITRIKTMHGKRLLCVTVGMLLATCIVHLHAYRPHEDAIERFAEDQKVRLTGVIIADPDRRPMQTKYTLAAQTLIDEKRSIKVSGNVLITDFTGWPQYDYGDVIEVTGTLSRPEKSDDFAYDEYLSIRDIFAMISRAHVKKIDVAAVNPLFRSVFRVKKMFEDRINRIFPEPHAALLAGLLTGSRRGLPDHITADFKRTGVLHITAISGFNVTIILLVMSSLLFFIPIKWRVLPLAIALIIFTFFVGASASVVRASIMGILGLLAIRLERQTDMRLAMLWTASLMTMWNPAYLWFDAGFQLSFAALLGLTECTPYIERYMTKIPDVLELRTALAATLGAQIGALPVSLIIFHSISLIAPLTNILIAPLVPLAMFSGFTAVMLSFLWFPLGQLVGFLCFSVLSLLLIIVKLTALVPFAAINFG